MNEYTNQECDEPRGRRLPAYRLLMFCVGVYVFAELAANSFLSLSQSTEQILEAIDLAICGLFFADFCVNLFRARDKRAFLKWGWLDLISSIPLLPFTGVRRVGKIIRVLRAVGAFRSARFVVGHFLTNRSDRTFFAVSLVSILLILTSSVLVLELETTPEANIRTPADALWWAFSTITTVGYGDKYPVTTCGRLLAMVLMTAGVGVFGTFTGFVASWLLRPANHEYQRDSKLTKRHNEVGPIREEVKMAARGPTTDGPGDLRDVARVVVAWPALSAETRSLILASIGH